MKVGDKLICHTELFMTGTSLKYLTLNKIYKIGGIHDNCVIILNDYEQQHWFDIFLEESNYKKWFYTERKMKLDKIKEINDKKF